MTISVQTQAILLLTAHFTKAKAGDASPLAPKEWGRFALWLKDAGLRPEGLLSPDVGNMLEEWSDKAVTVERVQQLLARGPALALAMEKWTRAGLWVLTRSDMAYPSKLKQLLKTDSPPLLFGCGNKKLLNQGGLAVVGSRKVSSADLSYASGIGRLASIHGVPLVSGGARGVDEASMLGAMESGGTAVGILADSLLRASSSSKYRKYLLSNQLVLISPFYPGAGFNTGNAMARNKYIYCLSKAGVVVHSGMKGGTWTGALENLRASWVPLWVKKSIDKEAGNAQIVSKGGQWLSENLDEVDISILLTPIDHPETKTPDLFSYNQPKNESDDANPAVALVQAVNEPDVEQPAFVQSAVDTSLSFYELFLAKTADICSKEKTVEELAIALDIDKKQLGLWLKKASEGGVVKKLLRPVRYQWMGENN